MARPLVVGVLAAAWAAGCDAPEGPARVERDDQGPANSPPVPGEVRFIALDFKDVVF